MHTVPGPCGGFNSSLEVFLSLSIYATRGRIQPGSHSSMINTTPILPHPQDHPCITMAQGGDHNSISPSLLENSKQQNGDEVLSNGVEESTWNKTVPPRQHLSSSSSCYSDDDTAPSVSIEDRFVNLNHWVCCICIVTFDLELGQALEVSTLK